jgi:hypothetical protein
MKEIHADLMPLYAVPEADAQLFTEWMKSQRAVTDFDKRVIGYPRACMARVQQGEETIALVPVHPAFMLESLARDSNLTDSQLVLALSSIDKMIQQTMKDSGMAEAFFQTNIQRFADICERHGWIKALYDPSKHEWLMKRRAECDWVKLLEAENAHNDQPHTES